MPCAGGHTAEPARSRHLRSGRAATRRPGGAGQGGGCPRAHPSGLGRAQRARRALAPKPAACPCAAAHSRGQLHLTACDRRGPRRVSRAAQGRYGACGAGPSRAAEALGQGRARAAAHVAGAATPPMAQRGRTFRRRRATDGRPAVRGARPTSRRARCVARWRSDGATSPRGAEGAARARAAGMFWRGG